MTRNKVALFIVSVGVLVVISYLLMRVPTSKHSLTCENNLRSIGLALHNYHAQFGTLPPRVTRNPQGEPLHSWRTLLLPFLGERDLYRKIDLTKPWNAPLNAAAMAQSVSVYRCPAASDSGSACHYLAIEDPDSLLDDHRGIPFAEILKERSRTIAVIESSQAIPSWGAPVDLKKTDIVLDVNQPNAQVGSQHPQGAWCLCSDGSTTLLPDGWKASAIRDASTKSGLEVAIMPDQPDPSPLDELLQKFQRDGGPTRILDLAMPTPSPPNEENADFLNEISGMDWIQLHDRTRQPFPDDMRPLAEKLMEQTGKHRYLLAATQYDIEEVDAMHYWIQEACIEEGLLVGELNLLPTLLKLGTDQNPSAAQTSDQLELLARTVARYWKNAARPKPRLHLPATYDATKKIPLVVCLHPDRQSPAYWAPDFCDQVAEQCQVAILVPTATEHFGPDAYYWTEEYAQRYHRDHNQIEHAIREVASQFQEAPGQRILISLHQSVYMALNVAGHHPEIYAGTVLLRPATLDAIAERSQTFVHDAKLQTGIAQKLYVLFEPEDYREKFAAFINKTLAPTGRQIHLECDEQSSFAFPKQLNSESDLAPYVIEGLRGVLKPVTP